MGTLNNVRVGKTATIKEKINGAESVSAEILDMVSWGDRVFVRKKVAPLGDPIELTIRLSFLLEKLMHF